MYDVIKFICFTHNLLHSIPQIAEMKQEIGLQGKKNSHNSFKVGPTNGNNTYDELQELVTRQSYSGDIFVTFTFQGTVFL